MSLQIVFIIVFVVVLVALVRLLPSKGEMGEKRVAGILSRLPRGKYLVINDLLVRHANGHTSQIDHVVVSEYGIFLIETKNYTGWIYGGVNSEYWTQNIYGKKYQMYNPIQHDVSVAQGRCPRCGGKLVLRDGKYGDFYGCSNYPRCLYTKQP